MAGTRTCADTAPTIQMPGRGSWFWHAFHSPSLHLPKMIEIQNIEDQLVSCSKTREEAVNVRKLF
jgi:hypothetical protein